MLFLLKNKFRIILIIVITFMQMKTWCSLACPKDQQTTKVKLTMFWKAKLFFILFWIFLLRDGSSLWYGLDFFALTFPCCDWVCWLVDRIWCCIKEVTRTAADITFCQKHSIYFWRESAFSGEVVISLSISLIAWEHDAAKQIDFNKHTMRIQIRFLINHKAKKPNWVHVHNFQFVCSAQYSKAFDLKHYYRNR